MTLTVEKEDQMFEHRDQRWDQCPVALISERPCAKTSAALHARSISLSGNEAAATQQHVSSIVTPAVQEQRHHNPKKSPFHERHTSICCRASSAAIAVQLCKVSNYPEPGLAGLSTELADLIHLPSIVTVLLRTLALSDLASLAISSRACAAVLRPDSIELQINREYELQALRGLFRLGCLDQLREASVCASEGDAIAGSYLGILGMCPRLRQLGVKCTVSYKSLDRASDSENFRGLVAGLPTHLTRTVHLTATEAPGPAAKYEIVHKVFSKHFDWFWLPTEPAILSTTYWKESGDVAS